MNRLADETSPYLRQHADNPVDWYPWGDEAFARARAEDRPILLSVGYSSCHWCHVMAHESFEDPEVAALMNRLFVNVKVDREERPDVDAVYMEAVQALTGRGGWPMTVFLAPDGRPFYGGTYFPPADRPGMPGFPRVLEAIDDLWRERRDEIDEQAARLTEALAVTALPGAGDVPSAAVLAAAYRGVADMFDARLGGFGPAPKFPQAMTLDFLLRAYVRNAAPETLTMVTTTLDHMAAGGIYDHVGGGFARYSTDAQWLVPHFEKMLYDQALLVGAYLRAFLVTGEPRYRRVVEETIEYVRRDLGHAAGGLLSAEDADSEGVEGKFYLWHVEEIRDVCGEDADAVIEFFGVTPGGNFTDPHTGFAGSILHQVDVTADRPEGVQRALPKLLARRATRVRPGLDDKVLLEWNALFLRALVEAAAALERDDWMAAARANARFLLSEMRDADGRFLRSWQDGRARHRAYAADHAALLGALLSLAEHDDVAWLADAQAVAGELARFRDPEAGGLFTTAADAEALVVRPKDLQDNATPSGSSLAADALLRLHALTGEQEHLDAAIDVLRAYGDVIGRHPTAFAFALGAVERLHTPPIEVALVGDSDALRREVVGRLIPASVTLGAPGPDERSPLLAGRDLVDGRPAAYVCERFACRRPVTDAAALRAEIDAALAARTSAGG